MAALSHGTGMGLVELTSLITSWGGLIANIAMAGAAIYGVRAWKKQLHTAAEHSAFLEVSATVVAAKDVAERALEAIDAWNSLTARGGEDRKVLQNAFLAFVSARDDVRGAVTTVDVVWRTKNLTGKRAFEATSDLFRFMTVFRDHFLALPDEPFLVTQGGFTDRRGTEIRRALEASKVELGDIHLGIPKVDVEVPNNPLVSRAEHAYFTAASNAQDNFTRLNVLVHYALHEPVSKGARRELGFELERRADAAVEALKLAMA